MLLDTPICDFGWKAPDFTLKDPDGKAYTMSENLGDKGLRIMFICNHCPFVIHIHDELMRLSTDYQAKGVAFVAISSNDADKYPADSPEKMAALASEKGFTFPYLYDETQAVAEAYKAVCTPDFSIYDGDLNCVYRGQLDDSRPGNSRPLTGADIRAALDAILAGKPVSSDQKPSIGCSIKWKGTAPY